MRNRARASRSRPGAGRRLDLLVSVLVSIPVGLAAQNGELAKPTRVVVVDLQRAVEASPGFLKAGVEWTVEMNRLSEAVVAKQEELRAAQERLATDEGALGQTARLELVHRIEEFETELARMTEDGQITLNALREQLLIPITQQVDRLLLAYAKENAFDLVLDASNPNMAVMFSDDAIDITDEVIRYLEAASDAAGEEQRSPSRQ